jgi:hypothetical protein
MKEKNLTEKAFTLLSEKILDHEAISKVRELSRDNGEPFVRFFKCADFLKDYRFYNSYKGRPDGLGSIRAFEDMTESNLYHYVYWRTQFLENNYKQTKREYILVYINELVNLVGVTSEEGLALLIDLWNKCDELTDLEFYDNIKDYCILHSVGSFKDIVKSFDEKFQIASYEDRIYSGDYENTLPYFDKMSAQHKILGSSFYRSEKGRYIDSVFEVVMKGVSEYFSQKGISFNEMLFERKVDVYEPFKYNPFVKKDYGFSEYVISETERYFVQDQILYAEKLFPIRKHARLISFILKHMESSIREILGEKPLKIYDTSLYQDEEMRSIIDTGELVKVIHKQIAIVMHEEVAERNRQIRIKDKFDKMRSLSRTPKGMIYGAELFLKQVKFMEKVEYNEDVVLVDFLNVYPTYTHMTNQQLLGYFSWRTKIRKGIYEKADIGYIKLYLNETILLANCIDELDTLSKLLDFWKGMRNVTDIDKLMEDTIIEFYVLKGLDMPFAEVCERFPEGYIGNTLIMDEIAHGNYTNVYEYFNRRIRIRVSKEVQSVLKRVLPVALKEASDLLERECAFSLGSLLLGNVIKEEVSFSQLGYLIDKKECRIKEETYINKGIKYTFENGSLFYYGCDFDKREQKFCEYVVNIIATAARRYKKGDFSDIPFDIIFSGLERYSKHAEIIESMRFVHILTNEVKKIYKDVKIKEKQRLESFVLGGKKRYYDPEVVQQNKHLLSLVSSEAKEQRISSRQTYRYDYYNPIDFYTQACLLEDVDVYEKQRVSHDYDFANRYYLNWRSDVRRGIFKPANKNMVLLYLSELVNLIGVENEEELMDKLIKFWHGYSQVSDNIDDLIESVIMDAYIAYDLEKTYSFYVKKFPKRYYTIYGLYKIFEGDYDCASKYILEKSPYRARESAFGKGSDGYLIDLCMPKVLEKLDELFSKYDLSLPAYILGERQKLERKDGIFNDLQYVRLRKGKKTAVINDYLAYEWKDEICISRCGYCGLKESTYVLYGIIVKLAEIALRNLLSFKGTLKSPLDITDKTSDEIRYLIETIGAEKLGDCVMAAAAEVLGEKGVFVDDAIPTPKIEKVEIDFDKLDDIREVSQKLTEKLVINDEEEVEDEIAVAEEKTNDICDIIDVSGENPYNSFVRMLNDIQMHLLKAIANKEDAYSVARKLGVMLEVVIEDINEVALETTGDTVVDVDCTIIEDYLDDIKKVLGG